MRVRRLGGDRAGEIRLTRFLRNPAVSVAEMVASAATATAARCIGRRVLAIQDTTVVRSSGGGGLYLHVTIAVDADDGAILGLVDARFLSRAQGRSAARKTLPVEAKESRRWLDATEAAAKVCAGALDLTMMADRESDIYAAFATRPATADLLVRAAQDRKVKLPRDDDETRGDEAGETERLFAHIEGCPEAGRTRLALPAKPGRRAREATLAVRFTKADVVRPKTAKPLAGEALPASVPLTIVDVREIDPPPGERVHWRLLTTRPVATLEDALAEADRYRRRWAIEQLFRTMKTEGFDIEGIEVEDAGALQNLVMAVLVAAVIVQQLVHARDGSRHGGALRPLTDAFEARDLPLLQAFCAKLEGKTARQKNPYPPSSLAYAAWVCARLGGWTGYYGKLGPVVMLAGWQQFQAAKTGVDALNQWTEV